MYLLGWDVDVIFIRSMKRRVQSNILSSDATDYPSAAENAGYGEKIHKNIWIFNVILYTNELLLFIHFLQKHIWQLF